MKKKYEHVMSIVAKPDEFHEALKKSINDMQEKGFEVEIQYQTLAIATDYALTALVLGFKREES